MRRTDLVGEADKRGGGLRVIGKYWSLIAVLLTCALGIGATLTLTSQRVEHAEAQGASAATTSAEPVGDYTTISLDDHELRWNPCEGPIAVRIDYGALTATYRAKARKAVAAALKQASAASGLQFDYKGATKGQFPADTNASERRQSDAAMVIAFRPRGSALLTGTGDVAVSLGRGSDGTPSAYAITSADVQVASRAAGFDTEGYAHQVLVGVAMALGLADLPKPIPGNVMSPDSAQTTTTYGPGDLAGLAAVGASRGCVQ